MLEGSREAERGGAERQRTAGEVSIASSRAWEAARKTLAFVLREMGTPGGPTLPLCDAPPQPRLTFFTVPIEFYDYFTSLFTSWVFCLFPSFEC